MAESTLSDTYWDLIDQVGDLLGWGRIGGTGLEVEDQLFRVRRAVEAGYLYFLFPPPPDGQKAYVWSFLSPIATFDMRTQKESGTSGSLSTKTLTDSTALFLSYGVAAGDTIQMKISGGTAYEEETVDSVTSETVLVVETAPDGGNGSYDYYIDEEARQYPLPDDFASLRGRFTVSGTGSYPPVPVRGEGQIRELHAQQDVTGRPLAFGVRVKELARETGQRWELVVFPDPDSTYTVGYRYNVQAGKLGYVRATNTGTIDTSAKTITKTGETFITKGCIAGDKVILSSVASGQTAGVYELASTPGAETIVTLTTAPGADGEATYEVLPANLYPLGGMPHALTLRECCKGQAEVSEDDEGGGVHLRAADARLAASMATDRELGPTTLGYNSDGSDGEGLVLRRTQYATYNDTVWGL